MAVQGVKVMGIKAQAEHRKTEPEPKPVVEVVGVLEMVEARQVMEARRVTEMIEAVKTSVPQATVSGETMAGVARETAVPDYVCWSGHPVKPVSGEAVPNACTPAETTSALCRGWRGRQQERQAQECGVALHASSCLVG